MKNRLTKSEKIESLGNALKNYKFDPKYFIKADQIKGERFAIASESKYGGLDIHTNFMGYDEFNAYMFGYHAAKSGKMESAFH